MIYKEVEMDLFSAQDNYYLAHCISADYALGAGIAVEFNRRFDLKRQLKEQYSNYWELIREFNLHGGCLLVDQVLNLVTKEKFYDKPTYESITDALRMMKAVCHFYEIQRVAMPTIGCGLDRLEWSKVSEIIKDVFKDDFIEILVCRR